MEQAARLSPSKLVLTSVLEPKDELNEVFTVSVFTVVENGSVESCTEKLK